MTQGRPKLSLATAVATGAALVNPGRYAASIDLSNHMLGPPSPEIIEQGLVQEWLFVIRAVSWLTEADRRLVELACTYRANFWDSIRVKVPYVDENGTIFPDVMLFALDHKANALELRILEKLGCTPTSRPKVTPPNGKSSGRRKDWW
jgi:hypothetical protein